jgi:hypothetical protein
VELLDAVTKREVVVGLAVVGAGLATLGSMQRARVALPRSRILVYLGYAISGVSVLLFIVAGFRS